MIAKSVKMEGFLSSLPEDVSSFSIGRCHDVRSLCDVSPFKHATSLKTEVLGDVGM